MLAFYRWDQGGLGGDVVVIANFANQDYCDYSVGFPASGHWKLRFNSDWHGYSELFEGHPVGDIDAIESCRDTLPCQTKVSISPYNALIYCRDPAGQ